MAMLSLEVERAVLIRTYPERWGTVKTLRGRERWILSVMVWKVGAHLRLHLAWRLPALMIGNGADRPGSIRR